MISANCLGVTSRVAICLIRSGNTIRYFLVVNLTELTDDQKPE